MKNEQQPFANNSQRIATPILGFLSGKCLRMASFLLVYLCVSHTEALLMVINISYLNT
jgi:hypothetical protein